MDREWWRCQIFPVHRAIFASNISIKFLNALRSVEGFLPNGAFVMGKLLANAEQMYLF